MTIKTTTITKIDSKLESGKWDAVIIVADSMNEGLVESAKTVKLKGGRKAYGTGKYHTIALDAYTTDEVETEVAYTKTASWVLQTEHETGITHILVLKGDVKEVAKLVKKEIQHFDCPKTKIRKLK
ncbi:hypothetical protein GR11A_00109 [Vibrio phage vB_VcorM_GR11A]|nr:hypothetical protein GR11A_00109 [Vibrio phage vB_VcorM_GR11A]